jgi:hypothetical protein
VLAHVFNLSLLAVLKKDEKYLPSMNLTLDFINPKSNPSQIGGSSLSRTDTYRSLPVIPRLAHRGLYWRSCVTAFVLGCSRPSSLGQYLWYNVPTVRGLMLLAISGRLAPDSADEYRLRDLSGGISRTDSDSLCGGLGAELLLLRPPQAPTEGGKAMARRAELQRSPIWSVTLSEKKLVVGSNYVSVERSSVREVEASLKDLELRLAYTLFAAPTLNAAHLPLKHAAKRFSDLSRRPADRKRKASSHEASGSLNGVDSSVEKKRAKLDDTAAPAERKYTMYCYLCCFHSICASSDKNDTPPSSRCCCARRGVGSGAAVN